MDSMVFPGSFRAQVSPELSELKDYLNGCGFEVSAKGQRQVSHGWLGEESSDTVDGQNIQTLHRALC